jgi:hypothetical protein
VNTYDDPDNYSISVLWRTNQRVAAVKALREAGTNHGITITIAKRTLDDCLGDGTDLWRNTTLILRAIKVQREQADQQAAEDSDLKAMGYLRSLVANTTPSGYGYDDDGNYIGRTYTDDDYIAFGQAVIRLLNGVTR